MFCKVHDAIISKGFREARTIGGAAAKYGKRETCYTRGEYEIRYTDYGPNKWPGRDPDSNRYIMKLFVNGNKVIGGTAWRAILAKVPAGIGLLAAEGYKMSKKFPMIIAPVTWEVQVECRKRGSIGIFELKTFYPWADDKETAIAWAIDDAHAEGYETRGLGEVNNLIKTYS